MEQFWGSVRRQVMPALVSVAAVLVSIAAIVFIVDTIAGDDDDDRDRATFGSGGGEGLERLLEAFGIEDLDDLDLDDLDLDELRDLLPEQLVQAISGGPVLGIRFADQRGEILVEEVLPGSPADEAGVEVGDVIERVDGDPVDGGEELRDALAAIEPGDDYRLTVRRGENRETLELERPEINVSNLQELIERLLRGQGALPAPRGDQAPAPRLVPVDPNAAGAPLLGVTTVDTDQGLRVVSVLPGLGAGQAGIEPGDIIEAVNGEPVRSAQQLRGLLSHAEPGDVVRVQVRRDGRTEQVRVPLSPPTPRGQRFGAPDAAPRFEFDFRGPNGEDLRPFLEGLPQELQQRLERIIEQLLEEGAPAAATGPRRAPARGRVAPRGSGGRRAPVQDPVLVRVLQR